jgi:L-fucose isomerase-like protein
VSPKEQIIGIKPEKKLGIVSFTDPRSEVHLIKKREDYIKKNHLELKKKLEQDGFIVVDPQTELRQQKKDDEIWGINKISEVNKLKKVFSKENISAIIMGCWAWNEPNVPLELAKKLNKPIALVSKNDPLWPGVTALTSTGATFWQLARNYQIKTHNRFLVSSKNEYQELVSWGKACCAINHMQSGSLLLWGGSPALNMEHLNEYNYNLKYKFQTKSIDENQDKLVEQAEIILSEEKPRIAKFINWLNDSNCQIIYDNKMTTEKSISKQIALYLASKDLLSKKTKDEEPIIGVSVKCQPELSIDYGVTGCLIPAFLPFPHDSEGKKSIIPTVCEGDIKGLLTSLLLFGLNSEIPPLFGDLKVLTDDYFVIANCGAASAFYAANSNDPKNTLSKSSLKPQCQGESGAAFGYYTPATKDVATYARIFRIGGKFHLQFGTGKISSKYEKPKEAWGESWPHTVVDLKIPKELFAKAVGTNHLSLTLGNYKTELKHIARILNIKTIDLDVVDSVSTFLQEIKEIK